MGTCQYRYNASELYQRTAPGTAPESCCGSRTFPAVDEPELVPIAPEVIGDQVFHRMAPTGRLVARDQDDPWCPRHGGSPEPPPPPVTLTDLQVAHARYAALAGLYQEQNGTVIPGYVEPEAIEAAPAEPEAGPVTEAELHEAADEVERLEREGANA